MTGPTITLSLMSKHKVLANRLKNWCVTTAGRSLGDLSQRREESVKSWVTTYLLFILSAERIGLSFGNAVARNSRTNQTTMPKAAAAKRRNFGSSTIGPNTKAHLVTKKKYYRQNKTSKLALVLKPVGLQKPSSQKTLDAYIKK